MAFVSLEQNAAMLMGKMNWKNRFILKTIIKRKSVKVFIIKECAIMDKDVSTSTSNNTGCTKTFFKPKLIKSFWN